MSVKLISFLVRVQISIIGPQMSLEAGLLKLVSNQGPRGALAAVPSGPSTWPVPAAETGSGLWSPPLLDEGGRCLRAPSLGLRSRLFPASEGLMTQAHHLGLE